MTCSERTETCDWHLLTFYSLSQEGRRGRQTALQVKPEYTQTNMCGGKQRHRKWYTFKDKHCTQWSWSNNNENNLLKSRVTLANYIQFIPSRSQKHNIQQLCSSTGLSCWSNTHGAKIQSAAAILKQVVVSHPIRKLYSLKLLPEKVQSTPGAARKWLFLSVTCLSLGPSSRGPAVDNTFRPSDLWRARGEALRAGPSDSEQRRWTQLSLSSPCQLAWYLSRC